MKAQSIVLAVAGTCFGFIVGWILGTQSSATVARGPASPPAAVQQAAPSPTAKAVDENAVAQARAEIQRDPNSVGARVALGNAYFDADRYDEAAKWYEEAVKLNPNDVNASTDLGVCYYYLNQPDRALQQFDHSLSVDKDHLKTLLNQGVVKAFGKQDLEGASASWQKVIGLAPDSPEGQTAKKMLDGLKSAHPGGTTSAPPPKG